MKKDRPGQETRCYITDIYLLKGLKGIHRNLLESETLKASQIQKQIIREVSKRRTAADVKAVLVKYVEEDIVYMADFEFDEEEKFREVSYQPVTVCRREKICIIRKDSEGCE